MPTLTCPDLGQIDFLDEDILSFPDGVPAFEALRKFLLVRNEKFAPFVFLVSVEVPTIRFICAPASLLDPDYRLELAPDEGKIVGLEGGIYQASSVEPLLLAVVTLPKAAPATANLASPIVINTALHLGAQPILPETEYSHATPLRPWAPMEQPC